MSFFMWVQLFTTKDAPNEIEHLPWQSVYKTFKDACDSIVCYAADSGQEIILNASASEEETDDYVYPGALVATEPENGTGKYYVYKVCLAARKYPHVDDFIVGDFVAGHIKSLIDPKANTGSCLTPPCDVTEVKKMVRNVARKMLAATAAVAVAAAAPPLFTEPMFAQTVE